MDKKLKELSHYRLEKAKENLDLAKRLIDSEDYGFAANRAYYSIFDGIRSVNSLNNFDSSKHAGVISYFNLNYVKTGLFKSETSRIIKLSYKLREKADYEDFFIPTKKDAVNAVKGAEEFLKDVEEFLKKDNKKQ